MPYRTSIFRSRLPRNREDIKNCIAMLDDSPFSDSDFYTVHREEIIDAWENLLTTTRGVLIIMENPAYEDLLLNCRKPRKNHQYDHNVFYCTFSYYVTLEYAKKIVADKNIQDINRYILEAFIAYCKDPSQPCPIISKEELELIHNQEPDHGLYNVVFHVIHPQLDIANVLVISRILLDLAKIQERVRREMILIASGLTYHALICPVYSGLMKRGFENYGNKLLHEYPGNKTRSLSERIYLFCRTKDRYVSRKLEIPNKKGFHSDSMNGGSYQILFDQPQERIANLEEDEQKLGYLTVLGYSPKEIAKRLSPDAFEDSDNPRNNARIENALTEERLLQNATNRHLYNAGYRAIAVGYNEEDIPQFNREQLQVFVEAHLHEVRKFIVPLYPWPEDVFLR